MNFKIEMGFVIGLVISLNCRKSDGLVDQGKKSEFEYMAENQVRGVDYIIDTIRSEDYKTCIRNRLVSTYYDLECCKSERDEFMRTNYHHMHDLIVTQADLVNAKADLVNAKADLVNATADLVNAKADLVVAQKLIGNLTAENIDLKAALNISDSLLGKKTIALKALLVRTCQEDVEEGIFPYWLRYASISRYEKWLLAISVCEGAFIQAVRARIKKFRPDNIESGAVVIAKAISNLYNDISSNFAHNYYAVEEFEYPLNDEEAEKICATAIPKGEDAKKTVCELIFHMRNEIKKKVFYETEAKGIALTDNAIFYGIIRQSSNFVVLKKKLLEFKSLNCAMNAMYFTSETGKHDGITNTPAYVTFKANCPKDIISSEFQNGIKALLKPLMNDKAEDAQIQIFEDPHNMAEGTRTPRPLESIKATKQPPIK